MKIETKKLIGAIALVCLGSIVIGQYFASRRESAGDALIDYSEIADKIAESSPSSRTPSVVHREQGSPANLAPKHSNNVSGENQPKSISEEGIDDEEDYEEEEILGQEQAKTVDRPQENYQEIEELEGEEDHVITVPTKQYEQGQESKFVSTVPLYEQLRFSALSGNFDDWGDELWKDGSSSEADTWPNYCDYTASKSRNPPLRFTSSDPESKITPIEYYLKELGWEAALPIRGLRYIASVNKLIRCHPSLTGPDSLYCAPRDSLILFQKRLRFWSVSLMPGYRFGTNVHCKDQTINGLINSPGTLSNKVNFYQIIYEFYKDLEARGKEHCFEEWKFVPETYNLRDEKQCRYFFDHVYEKVVDGGDIRYFVKFAGVHAGEGVMVMTRDLSAKQWDAYELGKNCGKKRLPGVVTQKELKNLYLIEGRKSDIRTYSLVLSTQPFNMIMSPDFFFRRTMSKFNPTSTKPEDFLSQYVAHHTNAEIVDEAYVSDEEWLDFLEKDFGSKKAAHAKLEETAKKMHAFTAKLMMIGYKTLPKFPDAGDAFHLFGWDYMLDEDLNPWWIETNAGPQTNRGHFESAARQPKYVASFLDRMAKGEKPSNLDLKVDSGKEFARLIDLSKSKAVDKFFGIMSDECVAEYLV